MSLQLNTNPRGFWKCNGRCGRTFLPDFRNPLTAKQLTKAHAPTCCNTLCHFIQPGPTNKPGLLGGGAPDSGLPIRR